MGRKSLLSVAIITSCALFCYMIAYHSSFLGIPNAIHEITSEIQTAHPYDNEKSATDSGPLSAKNETMASACAEHIEKLECLISGEDCSDNFFRTLVILQGYLSRNIGTIEEANQLQSLLACKHKAKLLKEILVVMVGRCQSDVSAQILLNLLERDSDLVSLSLKALSARKFLPSREFEKEKQFWLELLSFELPNGPYEDYSSYEKMFLSEYLKHVHGYNEEEIAGFISGIYTTNNFPLLTRSELRDGLPLKTVTSPKVKSVAFSLMRKGNFDVLRFLDREDREVVDFIKTGYYSFEYSSLSARRPLVAYISESAFNVSGEEYIKGTLIEIVANKDKNLSAVSDLKNILQSADSIYLKSKSLYELVRILPEKSVALDLLLNEYQRYRYISEDYTLAIIDASGNIKSPEVAEFFREIYATTSSDEVKKKIVTSIRNVEEYARSEVDTINEIFSSALSDTDPKVRMVAVSGIAYSLKGEALQYLLEIAESDLSFEVRKEAKKYIRYLELQHADK